MKWFKGRRISRLFENNLFIKILSVVIAVVAWFLVATIVNPESDGIVNGVEIEINETITQALNLEVIEGAGQKTNITVYGKRYQVGTLTASDFVVTAYPTGVDEAGEFKLTVVVERSQTSTINFEIKDWSVKEITVRFDHVVSRTFDLKARASSITVASGLIFDDPVAVASPQKITIEGPESNINRIGECVVVTYASEGISATTTKDGVLEIYDTDGQLMDMDENQFKGSVENFKVTIPVLKQKRVPLTFDYLNIPTGFDTSTLKYTMSEKYIDVKGPVNAVDGITELKIGYIDFKQLDLNYTKEFDIELPTGLTSPTNLKKVTIQFDTEGYTSKALWINFSNLRIENQPGGYTVSIVTQRINSVKMIGKSEDLDLLMATDLIGRLDLSNINISETGNYTVPVRVETPSNSGVWAVGEYSAVVYVRKQ